MFDILGMNHSINWSLFLQGFSETSFRHMCILSGCDYLSSVPGMGLSTANKLLKKFGKDPLKVRSKVVSTFSCDSEWTIPCSR